MSAPTRTSALAAAVRRCGWRAYAVAALTVVTLVVVLAPAGGATPAPTSTHRPPSEAVRAAPDTQPVEQLSAPQTMAPAPSPLDATACAANTAAQQVIVSIGAQHAWACETNRLVLSTPVTTGADVPDRETRVGSWEIQGKQTNRDLVGPGYTEHVDYWMPYDGDFGLHDATWQTFAFGTAAWRTDGSHGCVHLPLDAMAWVYAWAQVGATVTINA